LIPFSELGLLLAAGCGVCLFWGVVGSARAVRQPRYFSPLTPQELGIPFEGLRLEAEDGVPISAWLIRHPKPEGVILLLHGFAAGKADLLDVAQGLNRQGRYHLLMIDFRAHGDSGGKTPMDQKRCWMCERALII
jgi:pimeloyl-ACP methyl ester carboxylesterase